MRPFTPKFSVSWLFCLVAAMVLTACLPGEADVAERYNNINQRAAVENAGLSLAQAAQNLTAYRVAKATVRKSPLNDAMLTTLPTISEQENPKPVSPAGMKVVNCGNFGALAYFTAQPKGLPPLKTISSTMTRALAARFGGQNVGLSFPNGEIEKPALTKTMSSCTVGSDIMAGSPIFASGFEYKDDRLPDKKKATWPSVTRNVTLPCPSGYQGVIKREQKCTLVSNEQDTTAEKGEILIGGYNTPNKKVRQNKEWRCETTNGQPTAAEVANFCRDPNKNMAKPADNAISLQADSLRQVLESSGPGYYSYKCRANSDGTNTCNTTPFTSTLPNTFLRCDKINTPPLYVTNPITPLTLDASGNVVGDLAAIRDCGRGWTGKLTARYQVRRCNLYKTVDGVEQLLKQTQTIYHIAYAAAQCSTRVSTRVQCPVGNRSGTVPIVRDLIMLKPAALDYRPRIPGVVDWSTSQTATNDSRDEIKTEAAAKGFVIPDISRADLASASTVTDWSLKLAEAMKRADENSIRMPLVSCSLTGQTCVTPRIGGPRIGFLIDRSGSMGSFNVGTNIIIPTQTCSGAGYCVALGGGGATQSTCAGTCVDGAIIRIKDSDSLNGGLNRTLQGAILNTVPNTRIGTIEIPGAATPPNIQSIGSDTVEADRNNMLSAFNLPASPLREGGSPIITGIKQFMYASLQGFQTIYIITDLDNDGSSEEFPNCGSVPAVTATTPCEAINAVARCNTDVNFKLLTYGGAGCSSLPANASQSNLSASFIEIQDGILGTNSGPTPQDVCNAVR